jgi:hypothetical protein
VSAPDRHGLGGFSGECELEFATPEIQKAAEKLPQLEKPGTVI